MNRIVQVYHSFLPNIGGIERAIYYLSKEFIGFGYEVLIITSTYKTSNIRRIEKHDSLKIHRLRSFTLHYSQLTLPLQSPPQDYLNEVEVIQGWDQSSIFVYNILKRIKKRKKTVLYFIGVDYLEHHYNPVLRKLGFKYQQYLTRKVIEHIDLAFVTTNREKDLLYERYRISAEVVPHGVDEAYYRLPNLANYFRRKYNINKDRNIISVISRLHPSKGIELLIRALTFVIKEYPNILLIIAGKGDKGYIARLLKLINKLKLMNNVIYLGYISEIDKIGLIDASELIIIPSIHAGENYSLLIDEAKARNTPLVVTNYGALPYRIKNNVEGIVVEADSYNLAQGILTALNNINKFRILTKPKTWKEVATILLKYYQNI